MTDDEIEIAKLFNEKFCKKTATIHKRTSAISTQNSVSEVEIAIAEVRKSSQYNCNY